MFSPDAKCRAVSKAWLKFRGRSIEEEREEGWLEGVHPEDRGRCIQVLRSAFLARQFFQTEFRVLRADGVYAWVLGHGIPQFLGDGSLLGWWGELREINSPVSDPSSAKRNRKHLRQSFREYLRQIGANSVHRIESDQPTRSKRRRRMNSVPVGTFLLCLNACSTPVLALDQHGHAVFCNTAAQLFAAKHADQPTIEKFGLSRPSRERQSAAENSELECPQAINTWLDSLCTIDPREVLVSAQPLDSGLTAFSFVEARSEPETMVGDRAFLHDVLNVATGMQVLLDLLLDEHSSPREEAECIGLLRSSVNQLLSEIEQQRFLLDKANHAPSEA